jgi:DNA-directed RNA polymerase specialized sigma24 family protein
MTREGYGLAYQRGFDLTFRFLRSRGVPWDRASEITQAAWAKGWERLEQLRNETMVVTWVNAIALNVHRRILRGEPTWQDLPEVGTTPSVNLAAIDMARILRICCPGDRALLRQQMNGLTPREIAMLRGVPESAIRIRLLRARRSARLRIDQARGTETQRQQRKPAQPKAA